MKLPEFETLAHMAKNNPEEFEELREMLIEDAIASAHIKSQRRLRGIQFQIDMARKKAKTPLAACIRISEMMHESFAELSQHLNNPFNTTTDTPPRQNTAAKILSIDKFKTRDKNVGMA